MLENSKAYSGFAVPDLEKALEFYGETLGLKTSVLDEENLIQIDLPGERPVLVYKKPDFTPATYTILNFPVEDVEKTVDELSAKGITFERYTGSSRTRRASTAPARAVESHGSPIRRATSWRYTARCSRREAGRLSPAVPPGDNPLKFDQVC